VKERGLLDKAKNLLPGLVFAAFLAYVSTLIQDLDVMKKLHFSSIIIAIILGMILKNTVKIPTVFDEGIKFSLKKILRLAVILLGFKLSLTEAAQIGWKGLILVLIVTPSTLWFATWIGRKLGLDRNLALLIGSGTAICGASAVAAVAPVVDGDEKDSTFAIATVTIFGTISMFLYPVIYNVFHLPNLLYAVWAGSSIHEVAQVVAAGFTAGDQAGQFATLVKLTRVLLIIPIATIIGLWQMRGQKGEKRGIKKDTIPWFVFGFLGVFIINSLHIIPKNPTDQLVSLDSFLLTWAMAGMGLETSFEKMRQVGIKPFYVGFMTTIFISILGFIMSELLFA